MAPVIRKQRPPAFRRYQKYKPYLRIDFEGRCAYCHIPESRYGPPGNYHVDHFRPKCKPEFRKLIFEYSNLYYACADCNRWKGNAWPQPPLQRLGFRFLDPCHDDFSHHWTVSPDGLLQPSSYAAEYMIERLQLNRPELLRWRRHKGERLNRINHLAALVNECRSGTEDHSNGLRLLHLLKHEFYDEYGHFW